jgi:hypothetical protein
MIIAASLAMRRALANFKAAEAIDVTAEMILTCTVLHLSFIFFFFGNEFSWIYYFYVPVICLAAAARLGVSWELLILSMAFLVPLSKFNKRLFQHLSHTHYDASLDKLNAGAEQKLNAGADLSPLRVEPGFTYQLWFASQPSPATAGLWATPDERAEWASVLATIRGHQAAMLDYYGCADLLFSGFSPPVTLYLVPGGVTAGDLSRKLAQLQTSTMIVMPRWHSALLRDIRAIGDLVHRDFAPVHQGTSFVIYARRKTGDF